MEKKKLGLKEIGMEKLIVMLLCGVFLLVLSLPDKERKGAEESMVLSESIAKGVSNTTEMENSVKEYEERMEERVEEILSKVEGIGKVQVMLTVKASKEKIALKDSPYSEDVTKEKDSAGGTRESKRVATEETTILIEKEEGEIPYILKEIEPEIEGVLVLAEHGENVTLKKEIIEAVQVLFDVPPHKIKVMKMQENQ